MAAKARKIRPPKSSTWRELFRLTDDGEWVADDGEPGVAFFGKGSPEGVMDKPWMGQTPYAFSYGTQRDREYTEVQRVAMNACCDKYRCANGRRVNGRGEWS
jgi:hypothetical protein